MKIAVWHNLPSGGGKRALHAQVAGLLERGHAVEVWCPESADENYLPLSKLTTEHRLPFRPAPRRSLGWLDRLFDPLLLGGVSRADTLLQEMDRHSGQCAAAMRAGNFDVFYLAPCTFYRVPRIGRFLRGAQTPAVLYLQEPVRWLYEAMPEFAWLARKEEVESPPSRLRPGSWLRRLAELRHVQAMRESARREVEDAKQYTATLVNSYFSRESIVRAYGLDASVCYLGYDPVLFRPLGLPREDFVIGLGSLDWYKRLDTAILALSRLPPPRPKLVWVANSGGEDYRREMLALAAKEEVALEIHRGISDETLVQLLNRARLMLYTSHLEPFGYAPVEAGACGTPVVAVAEGGVRETIVHGSNGLLCDRDPAALAAAVQRVCSDEHLAAELGRNGIARAREWTLAGSAERLIAKLQAIVATPAK